MQLKTFTAATTAEAMKMVREELGDDAVIVSTQRADGKGVHVVATLEAAPGKSFDHAPRRPAAEDATGTVHDFPGLTRFSGLGVDETVIRALDRHGVLGPLAERLAHGAAVVANDPLAGLVAALDGEFRFQPIPSPRDAKPVMLIGAPGTGKTVTTAKLAARASMAGYSVGVISTDTRRAGANEQLAAFARVLKVKLETAASPDGLSKALKRLNGLDAVYIDSAQVNPFLDSDMRNLSEWIAAADADPVMVMAGGGDPMEADDMARAFTGAGARRMVATRLDITRRFGAVLAAAHSSRLGFSGVSITPRIANGLSPINAVSLARLILTEALPAEDAPEAPDAPEQSPMAKAAS